MSMANTIAPPVAKSGNSNESNSIRWVQRDNVVNVTLYGYTPSTSSVVSITGLPKPIDYQIARFMNNTGYLGYMEWSFSSSRWEIQGSQGSGVAIYGSFTYLTDEF